MVSGTWGIISNTVELTWALILAVARRLPDEVASVRAGGWQRAVGADLDGRTLGLLGLGNIGSRVARVGQAFGMDVVAWSANLTEERAAERGARARREGRALRAPRTSSASTSCSPSAPVTSSAASELARMKPTAMLVNTSRGPIVDDDALIDALGRGAIAGAGLDAFDVEPLPADHPYRQLPNVVATPHIGYVTNDCYRIFYDQIVEDITAFLDGEPIRVIEP